MSLRKNILITHISTVFQGDRSDHNKSGMTCFKFWKSRLYLQARLKLSVPLLIASMTKFLFKLAFEVPSTSFIEAEFWDS